MAKYFTWGPHYMVKAVRKAGITFPTTKAECVAKAGNITVQTDFDTFRPLADVIAELDPDQFVNNEAFYCAWMCTCTKALIKQTGY